MTYHAMLSGRSATPSLEGGSEGPGAYAFRASLVSQAATPILPRPPHYGLSATAWGGRIRGTQTGMLHGIPWSARCVQRFDDSRNSAIHITYRVSLRSSSMGEPRDPLSKVVYSS